MYFKIYRYSKSFSSIPVLKYSQKVWNTAHLLASKISVILFKWFEQLRI